MLESMVFGKYYFQAGLILIRSLLLGSLTFNSEVWYNISEAELIQLEQSHENMLRDLIQTGYSTPKAMLYLLTGSQPVRHLIQVKRLGYLQEILKRDKKSLLYNVFLFFSTIQGKLRTGPVQ